MCIRRALKSHQRHNLSLMLCCSHLDRKEKTLGLIGRKETSLLRVCLCPPPQLSASRELVCVIDMLLICWGLLSRPTLRCPTAADDGQLICGTEISVLERKLSLRDSEADLNWSHLVRLLWRNTRVRLLMSQPFFHDEGCHHPWQIRFGSGCSVTVVCSVSLNIAVWTYLHERCLKLLAHLWLMPVCKTSPPYLCPERVRKMK